MKNKIVFQISFDDSFFRFDVYWPCNEGGHGCTNECEREDGTQVFEKVFLVITNTQINKAFKYYKYIFKILG